MLLLSFKEFNPLLEECVGHFEGFNGSLQIQSCTFSREPQDYLGVELAVVPFCGTPFVWC